MSQPPASVLSHFWAPLCAVGSHGPSGPNAQICVSVFGASIVPNRPRLMVILSNTNYTTGLVANSGTLSVSVLGEGQLPLLEPLGLHSGRDGNKLAAVAHDRTSAGNPIFPGGAGWAACEVIEAISLGDSTAFLVAVREKFDGAAAPLTWQAARSVVGEEFLQRWSAKSAREQSAAREAMLWRDA
ncbi:MAG: flavin reductase family protein [bacterium]